VAGAHAPALALAVGRRVAAVLQRGGDGQFHAQHAVGLQRVGVQILHDHQSLAKGRLHGGLQAQAQRVAFGG